LWAVIAYQSDVELDSTAPTTLVIQHIIHRFVHM